MWSRNGGTPILPLPERLRRLALPGRKSLAGRTVRESDLDLLTQAPSTYLDTTHFDTTRFPPPPWAVERFAQAASQGSLAYTSYRGHPDVLAAVAESAGAFLGVELDPSRNLILTPGTQAGLFCALASLVGSGDRVSLVDPEYLFSERILAFMGANIGHVPLRLGPDGPHLDMESLETEFATRGSRLLVLSHPNNPTGAVYSDATVHQIADLVKRYDGMILVDELYARLLHTGHTLTHVAALPDMLERTVTLLGPSKTESMSGFRIGVAVASAPLIERMENVVSVTSLRAPAYAQHLLVPWLRDDHAWLAERLQDFTALRQMTVESLRRVSWLKIHPQDGTAYLWPDASALNLPGQAVARALLTEAAVLVSPGYQFGPGSAGHFRICYARDEAEWSAKLDDIVRVLEELGRPGGVLHDSE